MAIVGVNSLLNQYVPTFFIRDLRDGQTLVYDAVRKAFINAEGGGGGGGVDRLGELLDVSDSVDNPLSLEDGQALVYNSTTSLWENTFVDYNTLINKPSVVGTVSSVDVSGGTTGLTTTGGPITTSGTITLGGVLSVQNGGTGATTQQGAINSLLPTQSGQSGKVLFTDGTNVFWQTVGGIGTVTSVEIDAGDGIVVTGSPITTSGVITVGLTETGVVPGAYNNPSVTVDANGRITEIANGVETGTEMVVFRYSSGSAGTFNIPGALISQTAGVNATIIDAANCVVEYSFTNKSNPPKSVMLYGQVYSTNQFNIRDITSLPASNSRVVGGGGDPNTPSILTGFGPSNVITLQTRMSDTGASAGLGQRAYMMIIFGF